MQQLRTHWSAISQRQAESSPHNKASSVSKGKQPQQWTPLPRWEHWARYVDDPLLWPGQGLRQQREKGRKRHVCEHM